MIKKYLLLPLAAILLVGCAQDKDQYPPAGEAASDLVAVSLKFGIEPGFSTSTEIVPMATPDDNKVMINDIRLYIMKHVDNKLIVDQLIQVFDTPSQTYNCFGDGETNFDFECLVRPGTYNFLVGVNLSGGPRVPSSILPGDIVWDKTRPESEATVLVKYMDLDSNFNNGHDDAIGMWQDVFIGGASDVVIAKSTDLAPPLQDVDIDIEVKNVMGKVRLLHKYKDTDISRNNENRYNYTIFADDGYEFPYGYNMLGLAAYKRNLPENEQQELYGKHEAASKELKFVVAMPTNIRITGSDGRVYRMSTVNSAVCSIYYFTDINNNQLIPGEIRDFEMTFQAGGVKFEGYDVVRTEFGTKIINTLAFEEGFDFWTNNNNHYGLLNQARDESNEIIETKSLFGPYLELNYMNY